MYNETINSAENICIEPLTSSHQPPKDIGLYISSRKELSNDIRSPLLNSHWKPQDKSEYPYSERLDRGKLTKRYLNRKHLDDHPWVALSPSENGLFCVPCVLFGPATKSVHGQNLPSLVIKLLQRYDRLTGKQGMLT